MNMQDRWEKALKNTRIIRPRVKELLTFDTTHLPYVFLAESTVNHGDTVVRSGEVLVEKPSLVLPENSPQFEGFNFDKKHYLKQDLFMNFLFIRGITFPSLKYNNKTHHLDVYEGALGKAIDFYRNRLQRQENVHTGLISGPEDCWQLSVLIFICTQVEKSAEGDISKIIEQYWRDNKPS